MMLMDSNKKECIKEVMLIEELKLKMMKSSSYVSVGVDGKGNNPFLCRGSESAVITSAALTPLTLKFLSCVYK